MLTIQRIVDQPIISQDHFDNDEDGNINGPSVIVCPSWIKKPLGKFYMYFAHHRGSYIRLAYADHIEGPWKIYRPGTLRLHQTPCVDHIASPDVHVNHVDKKIYMFFHGVSKKTNAQVTYLASSDDGIHFQAEDQEIGDFYFKTVPYQEAWIGMAKGGAVYYSDTGLRNFNLLGMIAPPDFAKKSGATIRHLALQIKGNLLFVYYTLVRDRPESIHRFYIDLTVPMNKWSAQSETLVLAPTLSWEGADMPLTLSNHGMASARENALRDPAILEYEGATFLFYAAAGEAAIGVVKVQEDSDAVPDIFQVTINDSNGVHLNYAPAMRAHPHMLVQAMNHIDRYCSIQNRYYVMGCGRSGTWLLMAMLATLKSVGLVKDESPIEVFGLTACHAKNLVIKRDALAYKTALAIPQSIHVIYMLRHPFDVLTSHNSTSNTRYHISVDRWNGEMAALQSMLEKNDLQLTVIRYEDLVMQPDEVQSQLADLLDTTIFSNISDITYCYQASVAAANAMHGLRNIDQKSLYRWKRDLENINYLRKIYPAIEENAMWLATRFNYSFEFPEIE